MKNLFTWSLLMLTLLASAQDLPDNFLSSTDTESYALNLTEETTSYEPAKVTFEEVAEKNGISQRTYSDVPAYENGYYVINAVLSKSKNLKKITSKLKKKGFASGVITHPKTKMNYVYLNQYLGYQEAISAINTNFNNRYDEDVWILRVDNSKSVDNTTSLEDKALLLDNDTSANNIVSNTTQSCES